MDNGPEFISKAMEEWAKSRGGVELSFIPPGKPTQNPYVERFNGTYRLEVLNPNLFVDLEEVRELSWQWMNQYNEERPHESLKNLPPVQ